MKGWRFALCVFVGLFTYRVTWIVMFVGLCSYAALAQEHSPQHTQSHDKLHHWYRQLMRPDMQPKKMSCCNDEDCTATQAELRGGKWWAMRGNRWVEIPENKINTEESYDTSAHICYPKWDAETIFCFVKPGAGI